MRSTCFKPLVLALLASCLATCVESGRAQTTNLPLVTLSTMWRYNQTGTELGTAWTAKTYNDTVAGWEGPGLPLFGFESTPNIYANLGAPFNTTFADPQNPTSNFRTNYYFRTHFTLPSIPANLLALTMLLSTNFIDDGAIFYLNGVEINRFNMPATGVNAATFANGTLGEPIRFITNNAQTSLVVGDNVLAVELHQGTIGSSDEVFGMTLAALVPALVITTPPQGLTNVVGSSSNILSVAANAFAPVSYQWYSDGVKISGATNATYTVPTLSTTTNLYTVVLSNLVGIVTSAPPARVAIVVDTFPPTLVLALAGPKSSLPLLTSNQVLVTFNENVDATPGAVTSGANTNNYLITILGTTNVIPVYAAAAGANQVRLTTTNLFLYRTNYVLTVNNVADTHTNIIAPNSQIGITFTITNYEPIVTNLTSLFPLSQGWYWTETTSNMPPTWTSTNYDYSSDDPAAWTYPTLLGPGIFWYAPNEVSIPCGSEGWNLSYGYNTYYFRTTFVASNLPPSGTLVFSGFMSDGAVFYLNGTEVLRFNMPAGPIVWGTPASTITVPNCFTQSASVTNLIRPGTNVLAAEWHLVNVYEEFTNYFGTALSIYTNPPSIYTSPLPPKLTITPIYRTNGSPPVIDIRSEVLTWQTNVAGYTWLLDYTTNLTGATTKWTNLNVLPPYTNVIDASRKIFRVRKQ